MLTIEHLAVIGLQAVILTGGRLALATEAILVTLFFSSFNEDSLLGRQDGVFERPGNGGTGHGDHEDECKNDGKRGFTRILQKRHLLIMRFDKQQRASTLVDALNFRGFAVRCKVFIEF